jgi:hypothetical protein
MVEFVKAVACFFVLCFLVVMLIVGTQVPIPDNASAGEIIDRTRHGFVAELDVRFFGSERRIAGAREMVALDPQLENMGRTGARILTEQSPDVREAIAMAKAFIDAVGGDDYLFADALIKGANSGDAGCHLSRHE